MHGPHSVVIHHTFGEAPRSRNLTRAITSSLLLLATALTAAAQNTPSPITVDYPAEGSLSPSDIAAPTFLWRDPAAAATAWLFDITFADGSPAIHRQTPGPFLQIGEIDLRCISPTNQLPHLTPQQALSRTWKPDAQTWEVIKSQSMERAATVTITGFQDRNPARILSRGTVTIRTSMDPVGAPIFYRDVPLMPSATEKGVIKPLAANAIPLIAWRVRNVSEDRGRVVLGGMHTCANCHSFSADGKTLGMDLDGPQNDKGLYALASVKPEMSIRDEDVVAWTSFRNKVEGDLRVGFMSRISPDGQFVVTTIKPSSSDRLQLYYVANFIDYRFLQVFYPTRGILVWYNRTTRRLQPLPGADDPRYVHANADWSADGKYLVFARAEARDAYPAGQKPAEYANDPNETPIQYDLYRMPFNNGKGGRAEPLAGASHNGRSNSFPKISPDGRWVVFVQARNGQLMRPDSQLYIVPVEGGQARRLRSNTSLMNSWHSFSPNGRWLVFSSKSRSPYTQMYLTHLDEQGNDTPPILIENATAANRAVNLPEFVNIPPDGLLHIDTPATEFYRVVDAATALSQKHRYEEAIAQWKNALQLNPADARAHNNFGVTLAQSGRLDQAMEHYRQALAANPEYAEAYDNLGIALAQVNRPDEAMSQYRKALASNPEYPEAYNHLGRTLAEKGRLAEAVGHFEHAISLNPAYADAHNNLAVVLFQQKRVDDAIAHYQKALASQPDFAQAHTNLGIALHAQGRPAEALANWRQALRAQPDDLSLLNLTAWVLATSPETSVRNGSEAVERALHALRLSAHEPAVLATLAAAYAETGEFAKAVETLNQSYALATKQKNQRLARTLNTMLAAFQTQAPWRTAEQPPL